MISRNMSGIRIISRPETVGWNDLAKLQQRAHESNKAVGINMKCADLSAEYLETVLRNAVTLVALDEKDTIAGMLSIVFKNVNRWWHSGYAAYICYVAVAPEFRGHGICNLLCSKADEIVNKSSVNVEYLHTHVNNIIAKQSYKKNGFMVVRFSPGSGTDYYQIEMAKWLNVEGRKSKFLCKFMSKATEFISVIIYKPGKIRRF